MTNDAIIGFIGAGQMARALAGGFVRAGLVAAGSIWSSDPAESSRQGFADAVPGSTVGSDNTLVARQSRVVFLAVKPQQITTALRSLRGHVTPDHLIVSIAAGVPLAGISEGLGDDQPRLARVMPNTPSLVGQSASGYCLGPRATEDDGRLIARLMGAVGVVLEVSEPLLDVVTGLAGSGPAFVYCVIEALTDGGEQMGLPRDVAAQLAAQTVRGAAEMVLGTGVDTGTLKDRVTSPSGTTEAGLKALEEGRLRDALIAAVRAATQRSIELGEQAVATRQR